MNTSSIGVQTITPTTGTAAQDPTPVQVNSAPAPGTGMIVDKRV